MRKIIGLLICATLFVACNENDDNVITTSELTLNLNGLETLGANYVYEGVLYATGYNGTGADHDFFTFAYNASTPETVATLASLTAIFSAPTGINN